ncbi:hypothetical protein [Methylobacterium sp. WL6]|uniref:hypothetical protein n=1 Tax=Methylobacterium sp. WL6 TaxID=2603901 RepID=UPI0011C8CBE3|nr:hypothetical protein [Methylobacterium sp. WL6]TXN70475.1 hypothetical protein FV230_10490 [Methylobacterium sp. WL6]
MSDPGIPDVEFAPWPTQVQNDGLDLVDLAFDPRVPPLPPDLQEGPSHPEGGTRAFGGTLRATFADPRGGRVARFAFRGVVAFRVLDEHGLLELWDASAKRPRPARTTFRVRGHGWTRESPLVFDKTGDVDPYSHMVATDDLCLEVVCTVKPIVTIVRADGGW